MAPCDNRSHDTGPSSLRSHVRCAGARVHRRRAGGRERGRRRERQGAADRRTGHARSAGPERRDGARGRRRRAPAPPGPRRPARRSRDRRLRRRAGRRRRRVPRERRQPHDEHRGLDPSGPEPPGRPARARPRQDPARARLVERPLAGRLARGVHAGGGLLRRAADPQDRVRAHPHARARRLEGLECALRRGLALGGHGSHGVRPRLAPTISRSRRRRSPTRCARGTTPTGRSSSTWWTA